MNKLERRFYLVDAQVLPEVFLKVVRAKELLASGEARSISAATVLRIASLIGAYLLIDSGLVTDIAGIVICAVVFVFQKAAAKKATAAAA